MCLMMSSVRFTALNVENWKSLVGDDYFTAVVNETIVSRAVTSTRWLSNGKHWKVVILFLILVEKGYRTMIRIGTGLCGHAM